HGHLDQLETIDFRAGLGDDWLRAGYLKTFMDGTLGSQTARMLDGSGVQITSREELEEVIRRGARIGWPVAVHAIGDLANRDALAPGVGRSGRERLGRADRGARATRGDPRRCSPHDRRASRVASRAVRDGGAGARGDVRDARLADRRRAAAWQAAAGLSRRS